VNGGAVLVFVDLFDKEAVGPDVLIGLVLAVRKPNILGLSDVHRIPSISVFRASELGAPMNGVNVDSTYKHKLVFHSLEFEGISVFLCHLRIRTAVYSIATDILTS
jgi:hypothetical protein